MGKKEQLENEINFLRDKYKHVFLIFFGLLSGEVTILYNVISGEKPLYVLFISIVGFVLVKGQDNLRG